MPSTLNTPGGPPLSLYHPTTYRQAYLNSVPTYGANLWVVVPTYGLNLKVCQSQFDGGNLGSSCRRARAPLPHTRAPIPRTEQERVRTLLSHALFYRVHGSIFGSFRRWKVFSLAWQNSLAIEFDNMVYLRLSIRETRTTRKSG